MIPYTVGKLAPNSLHLIRGFVKYVLGRGYFHAVSSQNGDKFVTSPPLPIVELVNPLKWLMKMMMFPNGSTKRTPKNVVQIRFHNVSSAWELTSVSMRYSQGDGVNTSVSRLMYCTHD